MQPNHRHAVILMADDDPDDRMLAERAFKSEAESVTMQFVQNGEELLNYLGGKGLYADRELFPRPDLILLDLNMPRMDGRAAIQAIRTDPKHRAIPVIVLTTSQAEEDVSRCYELTANSYISKPDNYTDLVKLAHEIDQYWLQTVILPAA